MYESRLLLNAILAASCLLVLGWVRSATSDDIFWVGYQFGPSGGLHPNPFPTASFFHGDQWLNYLYAGEVPNQDGDPTNDVAVFDEGFDPQGNGMPQHVYFGDFTVPAVPIYNPDPDSVPGGDARVDHFAVRRGGFTFDFGSPINDSMGSLTTNGMSIGFGEEANTYTGARFVGGGEVQVNGNIWVGGEDPTGLEIDGATLRNASAFLGVGENSTTEAEVTGSDSAWINSDALVVGDSGSATLMIESGAVVQSGHANLGHQLGGDGEAAVIGNGSTLTITDWINVGNHGTGRLTVASGGTVECTWGDLGWQPSGFGSATLSSGGVWSATSYLNIGRFGEGELAIHSGATARSDYRVVVGRNGSGRVSVDSGGSIQSVQSFLGDYAGSDGEIAISGAGSSFVSTDEIQVGASGTGRLMVSDGATVQSGHANLGHEVGGSGEASVIGNGSTWTITDWINVGNHGTGHLTVASGGIVECTWGHLGWEASGIGSATLSSGGIWSAADYLTVGPFGEGELAVSSGATARSDYRFVVGSSGSGRVSVDSGGTVQCVQSFVGEYAGSDGEVALSGAGSSFVAIDELQIGTSGTGRLTVSQGANVETGEAAIGVGADGFGSATIESGAAWNGAQWLAVGYEGTGDLAIRSAATMTVPETFVAYQAGSFGTVTLHGSGSKLRSNLGVYVGGSSLGPGGIGTINLRNGGDLETPLLVIYKDDSVTLSAGGRAAIGNLGAVVSTADTATVGPGGTLRGVGTINGNVANLSGGTLSPGLPVGRLTINGNLDHGHSVAGAGGTLDIQINSAGAAGVDYDSVLVGGNVLLGGQLNLVVAGGYIPNGADRFDVVVADQISGAFESIDHRVISGSGLGQVVWGDYRLEAPGTVDDHYYVAPKQMADFNGVGGVTGADFTIWADNFGRNWATFGEGDANGDRRVTGSDFTLWADNFGRASFSEALGPIENGNQLVFLPAAVEETAALNYQLASPAMLEEVRVPGHAVPEPGAWLLLAIGSTLLAAWHHSTGR